MPNWLGKCLCIVAALGVLDGHLMVAQTWAWLTMLQDRAPEQGVVDALDSTFSGDAPCPMCCAIQELKQEKEEQAPIPESQPTSKYSPVSHARLLVFSPPLGEYVSRVFEELYPVLRRLDAPPSPPPQIVA